MRIIIPLRNTGIVLVFLFSQALADSGYRPESDLSAAFVERVSSAEIAVFPTIVRTPKRTSYSRASQQRVVELLAEYSLGMGKTADIRFRMGGLRGTSQWEMFQSGMQKIGRQLRKYEGGADYVIVLEVIIFPSRARAMEVFGIHCFVLDPRGTNVFSFLLNSHHKVFVDANLRTADMTAKGKEWLVIRSTMVVLTALQEEHEKVHLRLVE
ncbi:MAG: hypothetical protein V3R51_04305 [Gammaproteobacteria bacterium]